MYIHSTIEHKQTEIYYAKMHYTTASITNKSTKTASTSNSYSVNIFSALTTLMRTGKRYNKGKQNVCIFSFHCHPVKLAHYAPNKCKREIYKQPLHMYIALRSANINRM